LSCLMSGGTPASLARHFRAEQQWRLRVVSLCTVATFGIFVLEWHLIAGVYRLPSQLSVTCCWSLYRPLCRCGLCCWSQYCRWQQGKATQDAKRCPVSDCSAGGQECTPVLVVVFVAMIVFACGQIMNLRARTKK
jgi:hypothetical protein